MQYKRLGSIVAVILASAVGWSLNISFRPVQAETSQDSSDSAPSAAQLSGEDSESAAEVAKVGEPATSQSSSDQSSSEAGSAIAKVFPHQLDSRPAATVYVRDIPVLTFLDSSLDSSKEPPAAEDGSAAVKADGSAAAASAAGRKLATREDAADDADAPLSRANRLAAKLNRLNLSGDVEGDKISVKWEDDTYLVQLEDELLVTLTEDVRLPDSTGARTEDALQATNRLRRLLGEEAAAPLSEVANLPAPPEPEPAPVVASAPAAEFYQEGWASWYGPGFHGNLTANGEIFNQNALTAAHRYLSFGTWVRVTNLNTGYAVNVRINDRGPYAGDRVIDLSAAAADYIGLTSAGVAPVRIDILN